MREEVWVCSNDVVILDFYLSYVKTKYSKHKLLFFLLVGAVQKEKCAREEEKWFLQARDCCVVSIWASNYATKIEKRLAKVVKGRDDHFSK